MSDRETKMAEFGRQTGDEDNARFFLDQNSWDVKTAVAAYNAANEAAERILTPQPGNDFNPLGSPHLTSPFAAPAPFVPNGVALRPPPPAAANRPALKNKNKKFGSIADFRNNDADDDEDRDDQEYFAGGDKSGLAVQDPSGAGGEGGDLSANEHIQRLLHTARQSRPRPPGADGSDTDVRAARSNFTGSGITLGGEGTESRVIPDPAAPAAVTPGTPHSPAAATTPAGATPAAGAPAEPMVERTLHLWDDGFSVDDGDLYRFDDPANAATLEMINRGSAPLELMNVRSGQAVDVKLEQHRGEAYVRPKKKYRPFDGAGNRLGSPLSPTTLTAGTASISLASPTAATALAAAGAGSAPATAPEVDPSLPAVRLQIRLADGTRLPAQFNTTATVGDVRAFVERAQPESATRAYVLATTFPTTELKEPSAVIGELDSLKKGGNVVQKWA